MERDPAKYIDGPDLYRADDANPFTYVDPTGTCKVDIKYTKIGGAGPAAYYHSYIVVTDTNGKQTYYRAGPAATPTGGAAGATAAVGAATGGVSGYVAGGGGVTGATGALTGGATGLAGGNISGTALQVGNGPGKFGPIVAQSGPYVPGTIDWDPLALSITVVNDSKKCDCDKMLKNYINAINASGTLYDPFGQNSNTFADEALRYLNVQPPRSHPTAPGAGRYILVPQPHDPTYVEPWLGFP